AAGYSVGEFSLLRQKLSSMQLGVETTGQYQVLPRSIELTIPVFALVDASKIGKNSRDYSLALNELEHVKSQLLAGYIHLSVDLDVLRQTLIPYAREVGFILLLFLLFFSGLIVGITRFMTSPLIQLARLAKDVSAGKLDK